MQFVTESCSDAVAVIGLRGALSHADTLNALRKITDRLVDDGVRGVALNFVNVDRATSAGLAGLIDFLLQDTDEAVAAFALGEIVSNRLERLGLLRALPVFPTLDSVLASPKFRMVQLAHVPAIVHCPADSSGLGPLAGVTSAPLLDVAGSSLIERNLDHLAHHGVRHVALDPGEAAEGLRDLFSSRHRRRQSLFFCGSGAFGGPNSDGNSDANTLRGLRTERRLAGDVWLLMPGHVLTDLDLGVALRQHRSSQADITVFVLPDSTQNAARHSKIIADDAGKLVASNQPHSAQARVYTTCGAYLLSPHVLELLPDQSGQRVDTDLLPLALRAGLNCRVFTHSAVWSEIATGRDYFEATARVLNGAIDHMQPSGTEISEGVWVEEGAQIARQAIIKGPCHIGARTVIESKSWIEGPTAIGSDSVVSRQAAVRKSIALQHTHIGSRAIVDGQVFCGDWSFTHAIADGRKRSSHPLPRVSQTGLRDNLKKLTA